MTAQEDRDLEDKIALDLLQVCAQIEHLTILARGQNLHANPQIVKLLDELQDDISVMRSACDGATR